MPVGTLLLENRVETFREVLSAGREPAGSCARYFAVEVDTEMVWRTYRVCARQRPIMLITEKFPASAFTTPGLTVTLVPKYAVTASHTAEHWALLMEHPEAAVLGLQRAVEAVGAELEVMYFVLGEHDLLAVVDAPDELTQAAISVAMASTGVFRSFATHQLVEPADLAAVMSKAANTGVGSCVADEGDG